MGAEVHPQSGDGGQHGMKQGRPQKGSLRRKKETKRQFLGTGLPFTILENKNNKQINRKTVRWGKLKNGNPRGELHIESSVHPGIPGLQKPQISVSHRDL